MKMSKSYWTFGGAFGVCVAVAGCGGAGDSEPEQIGSETAALTRTADPAEVGPTDERPPPTPVVAEAASCTATSDGGKWCGVPISTPPGLSCTYTPPAPPSPVISTLTAQRASISITKQVVSR